MSLSEKVKAELETLGARHEPDEDRWYHPAHRQQWLFETPEEYLGWLKGFTAGRNDIEAARREGFTGGCVVSIAHMLRLGADTAARDWWLACGLSIEEARGLELEDFDLQPLEAAFGSDGQDEEGVL